MARLLNFRTNLYDFQKGSKVLAEYQLDLASTNIHAKITNANKLEIHANNTIVKTIDLP